MPSMVAEMPRVKRNDVAVKIDAATVRKAKLIASYRGTTLAEYLSSRLRGPVDKDYETFKRDLHKQSPDDLEKD